MRRRVKNSFERICRLLINNLQYYCLLFRFLFRFVLFIERKGSKASITTSEDKETVNEQPKTSSSQSPSSQPPAAVATVASTAAITASAAPQPITTILQKNEKSGEPVEPNDK